MNVVTKNMVRRLMTLALLMILHSSLFTPHTMAQKFALVDMEYILKNIPAYERANEQLNQTSKQWQAEVDALTTEAQTLYKNYQNEVVFLSKEQKKEKQDAIVEKEKQAADLKKKYFGPEGELHPKSSANSDTLIKINSLQLTVYSLQMISWQAVLGFRL